MIYAGKLEKDVIEKIEKYHLPELKKLTCSVTSIVGYRSKEYELSRNRSGLSEHTFVGKGAVDLSALDANSLLIDLTKTNYTRICYYPEENFFHCDFKEKSKRIYFINKNGKWVRSNLAQIVEKINNHVIS